MAIKRSETPPPLQEKPTLRRMASRRSFAISRRPTVSQLRQKLKRIRTSIFRRSAPPSTGVDYFSTKLPTEIRLNVYSHLLKSDSPLKLAPNAKRATRPKNLDILYVSRKVHAEALAALYDLNTISADRAIFCTNTRPASPRRALNHDLLRSLYITSLEPSPACAALTVKKPTWPASAPSELPCVYCDSCLLPLIRQLRDMPRLKEVYIDYHGHAQAIKKLSASLDGTYGQTTDLRLTCVGVGKYTLTGPWFARDTKVELQDTLLVELWSRLLALPSTSITNILSHYRDVRNGYKDLFNALSPRFGKKNVHAMARKVSQVTTFHDHGMIPRAMSEMWPEGMDMDFKAVDGCGREEFLHKFNVELQRLCAEGVSFGDLIGRRGATQMF